MSGSRTVRRLGGAVVAGVLVAAALTGCAADLTSSSALVPRDAAVTTTHGAAPSIDLGNGLLTYPGPAQNWVAANPNDPRRPLIQQDIAAQPSALWLTGAGSLGNLSSDVAASRAQNRTMLLSVWNIPMRWDGISAPSQETLPQYEAWIDQVVATIGQARAIVVLEPDALWFWDRLPTATDRRTRRDALRYAITAFHQHAGRTRVYVEAGTSSGSVTPDRMAALMTNIGIRQTAGYAVDVSSYSPLPEITAYAHAIRNALMARGIANPRYVIDTGRNGAPAWNSSWCNPPGQRLGQRPRIVAGGQGRDMNLWVKQPGTSDGNCGPVGGGAGSSGGQFLPSVAYEMITGG